MKGMIRIMNTTDYARTIDNIINEPIKIKTKEEACEILRSCGIMDENNNINPAYRDIIIKAD